MQQHRRQQTQYSCVQRCHFSIVRRLPSISVPIKCPLMRDTLPNKAVNKHSNYKSSMCRCVGLLYDSELTTFATSGTNSAKKAETSTRKNHRQADYGQSYYLRRQKLHTCDIRSTCLLTERMETAAHDEAFPSIPAIQSYAEEALTTRRTSAAERRVY